MARFKSYPIFSIIITLLAAVALGGAALLWVTKSAVKNAKERLSQKENQLQGFANRRPFPSPENAELLAQDLASKERILATFRQELKGRGAFGRKILEAQPPVNSTEAFFELASFVQAMRGKLQAAEITFPAGSRFGFSAYTNAGPEKDIIGQVYRQRLVMEYLLENLILAAPQELVSIQREQPLTPAQIEAMAQGQDGSTAAPLPEKAEAEIFSIDPRITARVPGFVDATAFRITFNGYTSSLRAFLNQLATFEVPVVVRSVEVKSIATEKASAKPAAPTGIFGGAARTPAPTATTAAVDSDLPLVKQGRSRITVTLEYINLVEQQQQQAEEAQPNS